jgi:hypothetical protein
MFEFVMSAGEGTLIDYGVMESERLLGVMAGIRHSNSGIDFYDLSDVIDVQRVGDREATLQFCWAASACETGK